MAYERSKPGKSMGATLVCGSCGTPFVTRKRTRKLQQFCSPRCRAKAWREGHAFAAGELALSRDGLAFIARVAASEAAEVVLRRTGSNRVDRYFNSEEIARRLRTSAHNVRSRISEGYFGAAEGVIRIGRRKVLIHWPTFKATVLSGNWQPNLIAAKRNRAAQRKLRRIERRAAG